jgi:hypothetical protein
MIQVYKEAFIKARATSLRARRVAECFKGPYKRQRQRYLINVIKSESLYFIKCRWENEKFNTLHAAKAFSRAWSF